MKIDFKKWLQINEDGPSAPNVPAAGGTTAANIGPPVPTKLFAGKLIRRMSPADDADVDEFTTCGLGGCPRAPKKQENSKKKK
jgi:hypothetical protein